MHYGEIKNCDIANGAGVRVSLFVSGCRNHCKGCFQPETWSFDYGKPYTEQTEEEIIRMLKPGYIDGLSLLGGDPMEPENQPDLIALLQRIRNELTWKNIWCYTGYTLEELRGRKCKNTDKMLSLIDILVDGRFEEDQKDISLSFRGSRNQRIIDLRSGKVLNFDR